MTFSERWLGKGFIWERGNRLTVAWAWCMLAIFAAWDAVLIWAAMKWIYCAVVKCS